MKPGIILLEEFMVPMGISSEELANKLFVSQILINNIINGKEKISIGLALRLSRFFTTSVDFWINLQNLYDIENEPENILRVIKSNSDIKKIEIDSLITSIKYENGVKIKTLTKYLGDIKKVREMDIKEIEFLVWKNSNKKGSYYAGD